MLGLIMIIAFLYGTLAMFKVGFSNRYLVIKNIYFPYRKVFRLEDLLKEKGVPVRNDLTPNR